MNYKLISVFTSLLFFSTAIGAATIQRVYLSAQLDSDGLAVNEDYREGNISGYFEIDLDNWSSTATGSDTRYFMTDWDISITSPSGGPTLFQRSSGESLDGGSIVLDRSTDKIWIYNHEDIDNPGTGAAEDRSLSLRFNTDYDIVFRSTFEQLLAGDPDVGTPSTFDLGSLQFSTSQIPTSVSAASFTTAVVPLPAPLALLAFGVFSLGAFGRYLGTGKS